MYTPEKKPELTAVKPVAAVVAATPVAPAAAKPAKAAKAPKAVKAAKLAKEKAVKEKAPKAAKPVKEKAPKAEKAAKSTAKVTLVVEHQGRQLTPDAITAAAQRLWTNGGRSVSEIKTLDLYVKAEDAAVYCVVNGIAIGKFDL